MLSFSIKANAWSSGQGNEFVYDFADDFYFRTSGSPSTGFGFDVGGSIYAQANAQLGLNYTAGFGLVGNAKLVGGGTDVAYNVDTKVEIANDTHLTENASIDTSRFEVIAGSMTSSGIDLSKSSIDLGLGGELKADLFGSFSYKAGVDIPGTTLKTKNPLYDPNEWIIADLPWPFPDLKTKNPFYDPNEWIIADITPPIKGEITDSHKFNQTLVDFQEEISLISLKGSDAEPWELDLGYAKFGARLPDTLNLATSTLGSDGSLSVSGVTAPFVTAGVDVDAALLALFGLPPNTLSGSFGLDWGVLKAQVKYNLLDAALNGNVSLGQDLSFDPSDTIGVEMRSSFGEVLEGKLGDRFEFETPEGEGTFTVKAKYNLTGDLTASAFLKLGASFDYKVLDGQATVKVGANVAGQDISEEWAEKFSLLNDSIKIGDHTRIDLVRNTTSVEQVREETFTLSYENFVTADSGINMTLTTHQVTATGGARRNHIIGNKLANTLNGGGGDDTLKGGLGKDFIAGGAGKDTLLGGSGKDNLAGGSGKDTLAGSSGKDILAGGSGKDTLAGGSNKDKLTGGAGNDVFQFYNRSEAGDRITDFHNVSGDNDRFRIDASSFGGGLDENTTLAASRFRARADNHAQDSNDRFIFRTTDETLWFDRNGDASGGRTMVANLQDGATMTSADIFLV